MKRKPPLSPKLIETLRYPTPFFVIDAEAVTERYYKYHKLFPGVDPYFAMKSNSDMTVLKALKHAGSGFEIASMYELELLQKIHVDPRRIIYGTAVKPAEHIAAVFRYGVDRFAADSLSELQKIARIAPKSRVFIRAIVDDTGSVFTMSEKFGAPRDEVLPLLLEARQLGLEPYGISFNVGSQASNPMAWANAITSLAGIMRELSNFGITLQVLNLGGGFPHIYRADHGIPTLEEIAINVAAACQTLPYQPGLLIEPGRGLVAHAAALVTSVFAKVHRHGQTWLYVDAGTYNALFEAMAHQGSTPYRIVLEGARANEPLETVVLAGPTGDGLDVITREAVLPARVDVGDRLVIYDVGAYTFCMAGPFNGFPLPKIHAVNDGTIKRSFMSAFKKR